MFTTPAIAELSERLHTHPLYAAVTTPEALRTFTEHHVFAVWDFMSLLKSLQASLTCVQVPWMPPASGTAARLINEIVLGEESDELPDGTFASHFTLYREAMREVGASTAAIDAFLEALTRGLSVSDALRAAHAPASVIPFVETTFAIINEGRTHAVASAFALGREDLVPEMFTRMAAHGEILRDTHPAFFYYLDRHIELDSGSHSKLAMDMLALLCGDDHERLAEAEAAVERALRARIALWDGVLDALAQHAV